MAVAISTFIVFYNFVELAFSAAGPPEHFACNFNSGKPCSMMQERNDMFNWTLRKGPTPTRGTGPDRDHGEGAEGYYIYIETSSPRIVNDYARISSRFLRSGDWKMEFYYHAVGENTGLLNVYTKVENSDYHRLVWFYTPKRNNTSNGWRREVISVTETSTFQFVFEGVVGDGPLGDIALDDIIAFRTGPASILPQPELYRLPISCDFEMDNVCPLVSHYAAQTNWVPKKGKTDSEYTGPSKDHTTGTAQGFYIYTESSDTHPDYIATIATPMFRPPCGCFTVEFWYHTYGSSVNKLMLKQEGYDIPLWEDNVISRDEWISVKYNFNATYAVRLLFIGVMGDTGTSDYALDDISIENCGCPPTTTITTATQTTTKTFPKTTTSTTAASRLTTVPSQKLTTGTSSPKDSSIPSSDVFTTERRRVSTNETLRYTSNRTADSSTTPTNTMSTNLSLASTANQQSSLTPAATSTIRGTPVVITGEAFSHSTCLCLCNYLYLVTSVLIVVLFVRTNCMC